MNNSRRDVRALIIKKQIKTLEKYKGTEKLIAKYKSLIEKQSDHGRKILAIDKSPWIIDVFEKRLNPALRGAAEEDVFDIRAVENAIRSLELFDRLIENLPEISAVNDYVRMIVALGNITTNSYTKIMEDDTCLENERKISLGRGGILSIIENSLEIMEGWEFKKLENTMTRLQMLEWSVTSTSRVVLLLDGNNITDLDENGLQRLHSTRNEVVLAYLNRGLFALGDKGNLGEFSIIRNLFEKLDYEIEGVIKSHNGNSSVTRFISDINIRISCSIKEQNPTTPEVIEALIRTGIRGVEELLNRIEKAN